MKKTTESDLVRAALEYLKLKRVFAWRNNTGAVVSGPYKGKKRFMRFGTPGAPDIMAIFHMVRPLIDAGQFVGIECKSLKGKQNAAQAAWQQQCEAVGGMYWLIRNLDDLEDRCREVGL